MSKSKTLLMGISIFVSMVACQSNTQISDQESNAANIQGYENNRRLVGVYGLGKVGETRPYKVTGRTSMGGKDPTQCEAKYSSAEMVAVTYTENGVTKTESLYVAGVNNSDFIPRTEGDLDGKITDSCGTVLEATFSKNGKTVKQRFVAIDRIHEDHAQGEPNLDIAVAPFRAINSQLGQNDNFFGVAVKTIAQGSYTYDKNSDCTFQPGVKTPCGNGW